MLLLLAYLLTYFLFRLYSPSAMVFSNWGSVTGLGSVPTERCFDARKDLVLPGVLSSRTISRSPFLRFYAAAAAAAAAGASNVSAAAAAATDSMLHPRPTLLFFHGSLCWQTYDKVRGMG